MSSSRRRAPGEQPREFRVPLGDVTIAGVQWPGRGPTVLFVHATSFHARCWDEVIRALPDRRAIAVDMRGHGRSERPSTGYHWRRFGDDLVALVRQLDLSAVIGVGHSMGGHSVTYAAARLPERFAALLLVDPVIGPREAYARDDAGRRDGPGDGGGAGGVATATGNRALDADRSFIARRRNEWSSAEEMFDRFVERPPFNRWDRAVLRDYCAGGVLPAAGGGFELACPPAVEAEVYARAMSCDIYDDIERVAIPVRILRARPRSGADDAFSGSPTAADLAGHFPDAVDIPLSDASHFIPMESPDLVASHVLELANSISVRE